jgi:hypothetical protein
MELVESRSPGWNVTQRLSQVCRAAWGKARVCSLSFTISQRQPANSDDRHVASVLSKKSFSKGVDQIGGEDRDEDEDKDNVDRNMDIQLRGLQELVLRAPSQTTKVLPIVATGVIGVVPCWLAARLKLEFRDPPNQIVIATPVQPLARHFELFQIGHEGCVC